MQFDTPISKHWQLAPGDSGLAQGVDDIDLCIHNIFVYEKRLGCNSSGLWQQPFRLHRHAGRRVCAKYRT